MRAKLCLIAALLLSAPLAAQDRSDKETKQKEGDKPRLELGEKGQEAKSGGDKPAVKRPESGEKDVRKEGGDKPAVKRPEGGERDVRKEGGDKPAVKRPEGGEKDVRKEGASGPCRHAVKQIELSHRHEGKCSDACNTQVKKIVSDFDGCLECKSEGGVRKGSGEKEVRKEGSEKGVRKEGESSERPKGSSEGAKGSERPVKVKGNNGLGNGEDPQPKGNPPVNDGAGAKPGNPGNRGGPKN